MTGARATILERIRRANAGRPARGAAPARPVPARARGDAAALRVRFLENLDAAGASCSVVARRGDVAGAAASRLAEAGLPLEAVVADDPALDEGGWSAVPALAVRRGAPGPDDAAAVTGAVAGIAETGSLMVRSGRGLSARSYFLPSIHIAVLAADAICGAYEDAFAVLRRACPEWPRTVTLITGPSRSSDIERIVQIGVHGPGALHVVLVDER